MITIIAEKPAVAMEIARVVGARKMEHGYISGNGYAVTWAYGHLVEIFVDGCDDWNAPLPYLPQGFQLRVGRTRGKDGKVSQDKGYMSQLKVIRELFSKSEYIINAGDAGREGELIQRYIYRYVGAKAPVKRLWVSSLSDEAIRKGLSELRPSTDFDNLYQAGKARNEADWLVGINATRAMTKMTGNGRLCSLGRVQTPTLALVCKRFEENRDFVSQPFWRVTVRASLGNESFITRSDEKFQDRSKAQEALQEVRDSTFLRVEDVQRKDERCAPPLLYDLTSLQRDANKRYSMTATETLNAAQYLYEKKLITYPRTGSRYVPEDIFRTFPALLEKLSRQWPKNQAAKLAKSPLNRHSVNAEKVTDHHALLPTGLGDPSLTENASRVYDLILTRFLEAVSPYCEMMSTTVHLTAGRVKFTVQGKTVISAGWKAIRGETDNPKDEDGNEIPVRIPSFMTADTCRIDSADLSEGATKPKPLYNENTLLEAMENAGKEIEDEQLKEAIRDCGLGTPATRASEIETIVRRGYVERKGKQLVPTPDGLDIFNAVRDKSIADVQMTASWEKILSDIAEGKEDVRKFDMDIREYASQIVQEILSSKTAVSGIRQGENILKECCPKCGKDVELQPRMARCIDPDCGWKLWREILGRTLSRGDVESLLKEGLTPLIRGFKSKSGKSFPAKLRLKQDGTFGFEFSQDFPKKKQKR
ncbi:MAG: topoisomerase C-terminal repeat-containing protein [Bacteroidales bacterium]|nr:topoisomerase C-terminal repeat-containing protein [Candidatus Cacconaster merdequi]